MFFPSISRDVKFYTKSFLYVSFQTKNTDYHYLNARNSLFVPLIRTVQKGILYRVPKCDVTKIKIFEIMGFTEIFSKYMMKNAYLPKITVLLQFGDEILAL